MLRAAVLAAFLVCAGLVAAQVPQTLHFQGYLTTSTGVPVSGATPITFKLYAASAGGDALWSETHASVSIANGNYQVILGSLQPLDLPFDTPYFLGVTVGEDTEMAPRQALSSSGYALRGVVADSMAAQSVSGEMIAPGAITPEKLALSCSPGDTLRQGASGWECSSLCTPVTEMCDGKDNDCDGEVDETFTDKGELCTVGLGVCQRAGTKICRIDGTSTVCSATPGMPGVEVCNGIDDDCDGVVDQGWLNNGKYDRDDACGGCGIDCTAIYGKPNAAGTCNASGAPVCEMTCSAGYFDLNASVSDGCEFLLDPQAIYVSTADGAALDDVSCGLGPVGTGSGNHPCKTIGIGLTRAGALGRTKVLVADGTYGEGVTLVNGRSLFGGYHADTWERHLGTTSTVIQGVSSAGNHDRTVIAANITLPTVFEGFVVRGALNSKASGNSYALYISGSNASLEIRDNLIQAGRGGPGMAGGAGGSGAPGVAGTNGAIAKIATGTGACDSSNNRFGGAGGSTSCNSVSVAGGRGGGNQCPPSSTLTEASGIDGSAGAGAGAGFGGDAGDDSRLESGGFQCFVPAAPTFGASGISGQSGAHANPGSGCSNPAGIVSGGHWVAGTPQPGPSGGAGRGGGGGGGGGGAYCLSCAESKDRLGGSAGGGGAGGCGGEGGGAGGSAGAAFGVFIAGGGAPVLNGNAVMRGDGGQGGVGGVGGAGGQGGAGGAGGASAVFCTSPGGSGGTGGAGGHGSGGGGGCGGSSFGIYTSGVVAPNYCAAGNVVSGGSAGAAGQGGTSLINAGGAGLAGLLADCSFN